MKSACIAISNTSATRLTKSGNDADVMAQMDKPSDQQVSYSIRIGHIRSQQHFYWIQLSTIS